MRIRIFAVATMAILVGAASGRGDSVLRNRPGLPLQPEGVEVKLTDGSGIYLSLLDDQIDVTTPYGKLRVKLRSVTKIDFGIHTPPEIARKIEAAIANLDSGD